MQKQTFYFSDGPYLQALQGLYGALCAPEAFVKLIGQARTGKSGVCGKLTQFLKRKKYQVVYFDYAIESPEMLRTMLARELNLPSSLSLASQLEELFLDAPDKPIIIVFDDAQLLSDITLLEIYRLADMQLSRKGIINILLCGEPSLEKRLLDKEKFKSLHTHASYSFVLEAMDADTSAQFLTAYLGKLGLSDLQLEAAAMSYFYKSCKGFPGLASSIAHLLVSARADQSDLDKVSKDELLGLIKNADPENSLPTLQYRENRQWLAMGPLVAVLVIASLAVLYQQLSDSEPLATDQEAADQISGIIVAEPEILALTEPAEAVEVFVEEQPESPTSEQAQTSNIEPEPVSDSNLSLVTLEEIGLTAADIVEPVFEELSIDALAGIVRLASGEALTPTTVSQEDAAQEEEPVEIVPPSAEQATVSSTAAIDAEPQLVEAIVAQDSIPELALAEERATAASPTSVDAASESVIVADAPAQRANDSAPRIEEINLAPLSVEETVRDWINAWEGQSFDAYFSSYHAEFEPRYHNSRSQWRQSRERVIGSANRISLRLSDFRIIREDSSLVEVHFWLAYQSPTYRDNTHKKLILRKQPATEQETVATKARDRWLILEEINLEVRT